MAMHLGETQQSREARGGRTTMRLAFASTRTGLPGRPAGGRAGRSHLSVSGDVPYSDLENIVAPTALVETFMVEAWKAETDSRSAEATTGGTS